MVLFKNVEKDIFEKHTINKILGKKVLFVIEMVLQNTGYHRFWYHT